jgi:D-alanyl-D-alanine carboxypeptidase
MVGTLSDWQRIRLLTIRTLVIAWVAGLLGATAERAFAGYSSIVIDAESGRVVMQHLPDAQNYPASLTKMMTLYLTFQALEQRKLSLNQEFTVSDHAAAQAPSKLGLRPGERILLHDLVFAVVTHSANDAAVVIAENIAGSEPAFAQRMTRQAQALGMRDTHFANASGLPNPDNVTTARDLATLARALYRDFPREYGYFATEEFTFRGTTYANHNHLMSSFAGMDGIKTGYIRASGFNLAASAVRDGRRLVAVVMGGESAHSRDLKMASLLNEAFARPTGDGIEVAEDMDAKPSGETLAHRAGRAIAAFSPVGHAEAATTARPGPKSARNRDLWSIQVGAFNERAAAERAAALALAKLPGSAKGRSILVLAPVPASKDLPYRARIVHFNEPQAQAACRVLHRKHRACTVIGPDATQTAAVR